MLCSTPDGFCPIGLCPGALGTNVFSPDGLCLCALRINGLSFCAFLVLISTEKY